MTDYRRLISYIYEYEGKQKGKNVGFVKLEARNGQCRIQVNVKRIYMGGNAIGTYLLGTGGRETFLGNVFVRNGNGEFRTSVDAKNVEGTGAGLDTYFGLSVHDVKNSWRCYKTIWEDALAAEDGNTAENPVLSVPKFTAEMLPESEKELSQQAVSNVVREIEEEIAKEEDRREHEEETVQAAESKEAVKDQEPFSMEEEPGKEMQNLANPKVGKDGEVDDKGVELEESSIDRGAVYLPEESEENETACEEQELTETETDQAEEKLPDLEQAERKTEDTVPVTQKEQHNGSQMQEKQDQNADDRITGQEEQEQQEQDQPPVLPEQSRNMQPQSSARQIQQPSAARPSGRNTGNHSSQSPMVSPELENPEVLRYLQETEDLASDPEKLWAELKKTYPKIQPFEYEDGCDILTIRPQDIGKLPRESWVYGNNSFLLHGYYNFRYLILVKLGGNKKKARYLLGVPGHYYSSEKYMATMFGFPNFVLSRRQPVGDGRFGYWYTDLKIR